MYLNLLRVWNFGEGIKGGDEDEGKQQQLLDISSMPKKISDLIDEYAKKTGRAKSEFVREAVRHYVRYLRGGGGV